MRIVHVLTLLLAAALLAGCAITTTPTSEESEEDVAIGAPNLETSLEVGRSVTPFGEDLTAMNGYDLVHMLKTGGEKVRGSPDHAVAMPIPGHNRGITYWFRSSENRQAFVENPHKYQPKYGGFCGWGVVDYRNTESDRHLNVSHATPVPMEDSGGVYIVRDAGTEDARIIGFLNDTVRDRFMTAPDFYERIADQQWQHNREDVLVRWSAIADEVRALRQEQQEHSH